MVKSVFDLDMTPGRMLPLIINVSQYDDIGRTIVFNLYSSVGAWTAPASASVTFEGGKPDGKFFAYNCAYSSGTVTVTIQQQMTAVAGKVRCKIKVTSGSKVVESAPIIMVVDAAAVPDGSDMSKTDINDAVANATQKIVDQVKDNIPSDYAQLSTDVSSLKGDLDGIRKKYDNLSDINTGVQQVNINEGSGEVYCDKNTIDVEEGKSYFVYVKFKITNLINWISGYVYARMLFAVDAGGWEDFHIPAIKNDGEYLICYNFTPKTSGKVRVQLYFNNQLPSTNTFSCQCTKLFVAETSDNITELVDSEEQSNTISKVILKNESVTWENLNDDVKKRILDEHSTNIIDCWGDSLTAGAGSTNYSYPKKLQELVGDSFTVNNYGQGSEVAEAIAFRQGGLNALIGDFTPSTSYVENEMLVSVNGKDLLPTLNYQGTYYGNNTVYIGSTPYFYRRIENKCMLACISGNVPSAYTRPMMIRAEGKGTKHILIVCIGQNGWVNTDNHTLADVISKMIEHNKCDKYIVVGIPSGSKSSKEEQEKVLSSCFGNHFVNAREYISTYGLSDSNLTPTEEDTSAMSEGKIPPQLLVDTVHMNDYGYIAMANCIYQRGVSLGYW